MTERERLTELICKGIEYARGQMSDDGVDFAYGDIADHLLANGVIVAPMPMAEWLRQELAEHVHERCMEEL